MYRALLLHRDKEGMSYVEGEYCVRGDSVNTGETRNTQDKHSSKTGTGPQGAAQGSVVRCRGKKWARSGREMIVLGVHCGCIHKGMRTLEVKQSSSYSECQTSVGAGQIRGLLVGLG
jgi:hypothetical protein